MTESPSRAGVLLWLFANLALVAAACAWWGWLDWQYVTRYWTAGEMRAAAEPVPLALAAAAMLLNLWLLRRRSAAVHIGGSLAAAMAAVALWWGLIAVAGGWFHAAIGGTPG